MIKKLKDIAVIVLPTLTLFALALTCWFKPITEYSSSERRVLEPLPTLNVQTIINGEFMKKFESYTQDQFPLRDSFRTIKSFSVLNIFNQSDNNDIFIKNGYLAKLEYPINKNMIDNAADKFEYLYNKYLDESNNVYLSVIPDKNIFLSDMAIDFDEFVKMLTDKTSFMEYIDIFDLLTLEDYYKTDTHWKQECITDIAKRLLDRMGTKVNTEFKENVLTDKFNGVYTGQIALPVKPDTLKYLTSGATDSCVVTSFDTGVAKEKIIYDLSLANSRDPYEMFTGGSDALITIENKNAKTDKHLIMFRDSFGSSIAPLFVEGYEKITLIDTRYINPDMLGQFVDFKNADVLFLYSTIVLNNSMSFK